MDKQTIILCFGLTHPPPQQLQASPNKRSRSFPQEKPAQVHTKAILMDTYNFTATHFSSCFSIQIQWYPISGLFCMQIRIL